MMLASSSGGILGPIAMLLGHIIEWIYDILEMCGIQNIGLSIILFTLVTKIILFPLTLNQQRFTKVNQVMQPEMNKIQKKYRNKRDQASMLKQQEEMNALYEKYGASPTSGCLPLLIQMPILLALYRVVMDIPTYIPKVYEAYEVVAKPIMAQGGYVKTLQGIGKAVKLTSRYTLDAHPAVSDVVSYLSHLPNEAWDMIAQKLPGAADVISANVDQLMHMNDFVFGINITQSPGFRISAYLLIPIIAAGAQYLSAKVSMGNIDDSNPAAATSKNMMMFMPIMSFVMCVTLPAAIGIYWAASAAFQVIQQVCLNLYYDRADMDKIIEKQRKKYAKKKAKKKGKPSLTDKLMGTAETADAQAGQASNSKVKSAANINTKNLDAKFNSTKGGSIASKANIVKELDSKKGGN